MGYLSLFGLLVNIDPATSEAKNGAALPDHIYLDAMGFGMGCSCLQLTFQACNVSDARRMYDGLIPLGPILVGLITHASLGVVLISNFSWRSLQQARSGVAILLMLIAVGTSLQAVSMIAQRKNVDSRYATVFSWKFRPH